MKVSKRTLLLSSVLLFVGQLVSAQQGNTCTTDYQCNLAPYGQCNGGTSDCSTTISGLGVDLSSNYVYFGTICRSSDPYGNTTIKRVSVNGGVAQSVYTEGVIPAAGNIGAILAAVNGWVYYFRSERGPGTVPEAYVVSSGETTSFGTNGFFQSELDIQGGESFTASLVPGPNGLVYEIDRYTAVIGQSNSGTGSKVYTLPGSPGPIRRGAGQDLIFTVYNYSASEGTTTTFYRGTITGGDSLPSSSFIVAGYVNDFSVDASGSIIVYGNNTGLFKRVGSTTTKISSDSVIGVYIMNNKVIYNNGVTIRSINLDGTGVTNLVQASSGTCSCINGFSGSNCQTCSNGQVQWSNGIPSCVAYNAQGFPATCEYDYQCGNVPYTVCSAGACTCRDNFTGSKCDQCAAPRSISWSNGTPSCS